MVDICRHSIYFDTLEGLMQCLGEMERDHDVVLVLITALTNAFGAAAVLSSNVFLCPVRSGSRIVLTLALIPSFPLATAT